MGIVRALHSACLCLLCCPACGCHIFWNKCWNGGPLAALSVLVFHKHTAVLAPHRLHHKTCQALLLNAASLSQKSFLE